MYPCVTGGVRLFLCSTPCAVGGAVMERGDESMRKGLVKTLSQLLHHYLIPLLDHICLSCSLWQQDDTLDQLS